jgi:putative N6-adenine-specific DNA methylase
MFTTVDKVTLIATATFGLEAVVKRELQDLGFENLTVSEGKVGLRPPRTISPGSTCG